MFHRILISQNLFKSLNISNMTTHPYHKSITFTFVTNLTSKTNTTPTTYMTNNARVIAISESEAIRLKSYQGRTMKIQKAKNFLKSHYSLSKISTDVFVRLSRLYSDSVCIHVRPLN